MRALGSGDGSTMLQGSGRQWRDVRMVQDVCMVQGMCMVQGVRADPIRHLHESGLPFTPYA